MNIYNLFLQHILVTLLSLSVHTHTHTHTETLTVTHTHQPRLSQSPSCLGNLSAAGRYNTLDLCCCVIDFPEVPVGAASLMIVGFRMDFEVALQHSLGESALCSLCTTPADDAELVL